MSETSNYYASIRRALIDAQNASCIIKLSDETPSPHGHVEPLYFRITQLASGVQMTPLAEPSAARVLKHTDDLAMAFLDIPGCEMPRIDVAVSASERFTEIINSVKLSMENMVRQAITLPHEDVAAAMEQSQDQAVDQRSFRRR